MTVGKDKQKKKIKKRQKLHIALYKGNRDKHMTLYEDRKKTGNTVTAKNKQRSQGHEAKKQTVDRAREKSKEQARDKSKDRSKVKTRGSQLVKGETRKLLRDRAGRDVAQDHANQQVREKVTKVEFEKPGNFLYPVPAVMVSCAGKDGKPNIITVAWAGTVCTNPPMLSISIKKERYSYHLIKESGEFVVNLTNKSLAKATDYCGCRSGRDHDKFAECQLTPGKSAHISAPTIQEAPVSIECKVREVIPLGSHDMFLADVLGIQVDERYMDEKKTLHLEKANLITYSHGKYFTLGNILGTFGYAVRKERGKNRVK